jgi:hypothetical protein
MKKYFLLTLFIALIFSGIQCSVYETITNISRLQFKLGAVNGFQIVGVSVTGKSKLSDFSAIDLLKLSSSFIKGSFPASFVLNVEAKNPNDGTGGYKRTDATLQNFKWRLFLDDKETVTGDLDQPITVPGTGEVTVIPLRINVDLLKFFKDKSYDDIMNLVLALGGNKGSAAKITLYATPTVSSVLGNITYPGELKLVDYTFTK